MSDIKAYLHEYFLKRVIEKEKNILNGKKEHSLIKRERIIQSENKVYKKQKKDKTQFICTKNKKPIEICDSKKRKEHKIKKEGKDIYNNNHEKDELDGYVYEILEEEGEEEKREEEEERGKEEIEITEQVYINDLICLEVEEGTLKSVILTINNLVNNLKNYKR